MKRILKAKKDKLKIDVRDYSNSLDISLSWWLLSHVVFELKVGEGAKV
jgi:hypothetical protein